LDQPKGAGIAGGAVEGPPERSLMSDFCMSSMTTAGRAVGPPEGAGTVKRKEQQKDASRCHEGATDAFLGDAVGSKEGTKPGRVAVEWNIPTVNPSD
jgi:hypothetical protein